MLLSTEEYVEQAYLYETMGKRISENQPIQELLKQIRDELLVTTNLPKAVDFVLDELNHAGSMATAMKRLAHYFTPFQTYLVSAAEDDRGRFDIYMAFIILQHEAKYRSGSVDAQSMFFFQFETLCRNRLDYDRGLAAIATDPVYDKKWSKWIMDFRHLVGIIDIADLVYIHSEYYIVHQQKINPDNIQRPDPILFGEREGKIALANRRTEPLFFFSALQRHLKYPPVPRPKPRNQQEDVIPKLQRLVDRLEVRVKLLEDEQREKGIDLTRFYNQADQSDLTD